MGAAQRISRGGGIVEEFEKFRILVVEDGLLNLYAIEQILKDTYELEMAKTAAEAFRAISEFQPHLILLDIILPDANGFDILATLQAADSTRSIPVIIITGLESDLDEERGFLLGAVDYIRKPFKDPIVKARVNTQIRIIKQIQTIEQLGLVDPLTAIPNRRAFDDHSRYEWGRAMRDQSPVAALMLDVDKFKVYNDTYGHPQGDVMLKAVAQTIKGTLNRAVDLYCRYGGEEFAILLPSTGYDGALLVAERIRAGIERMEVPLQSGKGITKATISIGVAVTVPQPGSQLAGLIETADQMLYKAKNNGRNQAQGVKV